MRISETSDTSKASFAKMTPVSVPKQGPAYLQNLVGLVLIVAILYLAKSVIVPLALAVLLTFILTPIVIVVQRRGLKRIYAVLVVVVCAFLLFGVVSWGVLVQVRTLANDLPTHTAEINQKLASLRGSDGTIAKLLQMVRDISAGPEKKTEAADNDNKDINDAKQVIVAQPETSSSFERLFHMVIPVLEPLATAGLVLILLIFMLIKREDLRNRLIGLVGHGRLIGTTRVFVDAAQRLSRFLLNQLLVNAGFGLLFGLGLFALGVPYAFLWGFLTTVLRFVPYVGTWMAAAFPLILSFAVAKTWTQPILVLAFFGVLDLITANVVEPLLFGRSTGVSPIALLVAAAFWTWIWGPIGLVLSTPLTVCLVVLGQHVPRLKFLTLLLGDQPGLPPHVGYYQRLLARDEKEARDVIQQYVLAHGRDKVYDDVFLPALALARRDRKHGGLTVDEEDYIYQETRKILDGLSEPASLPAGEGQKAVSALVLGCPAHHEAEELSLQMLAHLLQPSGCQLDGITTKVLPSQIETRIEQERPALVFLAVLPPGGLVQARYLCKRLRKRFADLTIVVGYWGQTRNFDKLLVSLRLAGAAYVTTSLLQSRSQIQTLVEATASSTVSPTIQPAGVS
jgi:predicted PurR-regulated permease PerM